MPPNLPSPQLLPVPAPRACGSFPAPYTTSSTYRSWHWTRGPGAPARDTAASVHELRPGPPPPSAAASAGHKNSAEGSPTGLCGQGDTERESGRSRCQPGEPQRRRCRSKRERSQSAGAGTSTGKGVGTEERLLLLGTQEQDIDCHKKSNPESQGAGCGLHAIALPQRAPWDDRPGEASEQGDKEGRALG